jgi:hypothetical protein
MPNERHGDDRHLVMADMKAAAAASGTSLEDAWKNIQKTMSTVKPAATSGRTTTAAAKPKAASAKPATAAAKPKASSAKPAGKARQTAQASQRG